MRKFIIFETNGKRFDSYEEALKYEKLCKKVYGIMSQLLPRTKEIEQGIDFNKHNKETLNGCLKPFVKSVPNKYLILNNGLLRLQMVQGIYHI